MRNQRKRILSLIIAFMVGFGSIGIGTISTSAINTKPTYSITNEIKSNNGKTKEYFKVKTPLNEKNVIYVEGKVKTDVKRLCIRLKKHKSSEYTITTFVTPNKNGEFSIKINTKKGNKIVPKVVNGKGTVASASSSYGTKPGYKAVGKMSSGIYHLTIAEAKTTKDAKITGDWWEGGLGGNKGYALNVLLRVKSGDENNLKLIKYKSVISNNTTKTNSLEPNDKTINSYTGSYVRYTDKYLRDFSYFLVNSHNGKKADSLTTSQVNYISKVANNITNETDTDYEKVQKIYEYVATNFYYDNLAHDTGKHQYGNPYYNLYNQRNKVKSRNSDNNGRVGTVCFGYATMVVSLARSEGIPARLVEGRHISINSTLWSNLNLSNLNKNTHWWAEVWVDGKWITVDADAGSSNTWDRKSFSSKGTYNKLGLTRYTGFDPSKELFANSYITHKIRGGSTNGKYIIYIDEVKQLETFLNTIYNGKTNGKKLNAEYNPLILSSWGDGELSNFKTDGYGKIYKISWINKELYGDANFSNFKSLKYLSIYNNELTNLNIKGCTNLTGLWATYNNIKKFDSTTCKNLETISMKGNELTTAKFRANGKNVTLKSNYSSCNFGFKKDGKTVTIYVNKAPKGYKYLGIYDSNGKKLSSSTEYSFTASNKYSKTYTVKYKKN